jgi:zinc D-Ala-D-Ala carboxypeptidase
MSRRRAQALCTALGIMPATLAGRELPFHAEARSLVPVGLGGDGRDKFLVAAAARAWRAMQVAAAQDGVALHLISAFRSYAFQASLIEAKLQRGRTLSEVLAINAPPGHSEHHTGRAIDIGTPGCAALDEAFADTPAFGWLQGHAPSHGFSLSYPRHNAQGFIYEPWHWCWRRH